MALIDPAELVGMYEVSRMADLTDARIGQLRRAGKMPAPVATVKATPLWLASDIQHWLDNRVLGKPGRPKKEKNTP
jgi:hypothetical protein